MNVEKCEEWNKEKLKLNPKNPLTNRKIKVHGPKYNELDRTCKNFIVDINKICLQWLKNNNYGVLPSKPNEILTSDSDTEYGTTDTTITESYYTTTIRKFNGSIIKNYFSDIIIAEGKACMTESKTLLKYVKRPKFLGYGSFGNVYSVTIPNTSISAAIKEGRISKTDLKKAKDNRYPLEYLFNKLINDLIDDKTCSNFSYTFAIFFCEKCTLNEFTQQPIHTQCSETIVELFDYTLDKLKDLRNEVVLSLIFQILYAVACIQIKYGMYHGDIKKENILIKVIPSGGYWVYKIFNKIYKVPNYGYIAILNDFGVSGVFKPGFSEKNYGRRQAEVIHNNNEWYFKPFTTQEYPNLQKNGKITSIPPYKLGDDGTWNQFYKNFNSKPSIKVDLNDMIKFPVFYFHHDVVDVIFMFIGGKRALQVGNHKSMNLRRETFDLLTNLNFYLLRSNEQWPINRVDMFLAIVTIEKIFSENVLFNIDGQKIEEYHLF